MKISKSIFTVAALAVALTTTSCTDYLQNGTIDLSGYVPEPEVTLTYNHPCALYDADHFTEIKNKIANNTLNAQSAEEWQALQNNIYTNSPWGTETHEVEILVRGADYKGVHDNCINAAKDAASAYQYGLMYLLTDNTTYAEKALTILNAWKNTCKEVMASDNNYYLCAGAQGFTFALAGEELSVYWKEKDPSEFQAFQDWIVDVFGSKNYRFLSTHGSPNCNSPKHYMSNWDLVNLCSYFQIGILTENDEIIKFCTSYFTSSGDGLGALSNIRIADYQYTNPEGSETITQSQESGRDQGHATMAIVVAAHLAQAAWALYQSNPDYTALDFFTTNKNQLLHMAEYNSFVNMWNGDHSQVDGVNNKTIFPSDTGDPSWFTTIADIDANYFTATPENTWCTGKNHEAQKGQFAFANATESRGHLRPGYEIFYNHYKNVDGIAPKDIYFSKKYIDLNRPEGGAGDSRYGSTTGAFDQIGWGTLMLYNGD